MEIELLSSFDCPHIVGYYGQFRNDTEICIVMEFCAHNDLCGFIKRQGKRPLAENWVWKVFIQIALGIQYMHAKDVIHRDIKSLNIFLTKDNSARVGDVGASRRLDKEGNIIDDLDGD